MDISIIINIIAITVEFIALSFVIYELRNSKTLINKIQSGQKSMRILLDNLKRNEKSTNVAVNQISRSVSTMNKIVETIERKDLLRKCTETASKAKDSIINISYTFHTKEEEAEMGPFLECCEKKAKDGVKIRCLGPPHDNHMDRFYVRKKIGAEIRINHALLGFDTRYLIVDNSIVLITVGDTKTDARKGFVFESVKLANMLSKPMKELWENSIRYDDYLIKIIMKTIRNSSFPQKMHTFTDRFKLPIEEIKRICEEMKKRNMITIHDGFISMNK